MPSKIALSKKELNLNYITVIATTIALPLVPIILEIANLIRKLVKKS